MIFIWKALDVQEHGQFCSRDLRNGLQVNLASPDRKSLQLQLEGGIRLVLSPPSLWSEQIGKLSDREDASSLESANKLWGHSIKKSETICLFGYGPAFVPKLADRTMFIEN